MVSGDSLLFEHSAVANVITVTLAQPLTANDLLGKSILVTTLVANRPDGDSGSAVILVNIPVTTPSPLPAFEKSAYQGSLNENHELTMENIILKENTFGQGVTFQLEGGK